MNAEENAMTRLSTEHANMEKSDKGKIKHKTFTYRTSTSWTGGKSGILSADGKPSLRISNPPEFRGEAGVWTPEDMFVASVEVCHMATFLSFAARKDVPIISYKSHANGVLEFTEGDYKFTRIVIFPTVVVSSLVAEKEVYLLLKEAQEHCLVANSIASIVEISPTIMLE
jgi:organic hydroperoxide reductase OsmC/OhrA